MPHRLTLVQDFFKRQIEDWRLAGTNYSDLRKCILKEFSVRGNIIRVQYNPARMTSTSAKIDSHSIANRKCFLCRENRPDEQHDFPFNSTYIVLVNPFPIFPEHFTIPKTLHSNQEVAGEIFAMVEMVIIFGDVYSVFYNGPKCGASAPDHHHFQMGTANFMPLEAEAGAYMPNNHSISADGYSISAVHDGLRSYMLFRLQKMLYLHQYVKAIEEFIQFYTMYCGSGEEPMLNIIAYKDSATGDFLLLVFLRAKHRPDLYFADEPNKIIISPASVDVGGKIITPRKEDFDRVDKTLIETIFEEVFVTEKQLHMIFDAFKQKAGL